jgi:hypothetical protein
VDGRGNPYLSIGGPTLTDLTHAYPLTARYIMIRHTDADYLSLAEVQVFGPSAPDIAVHKTATQSSNYANGAYPAAHSVDGYVDGAPSTGSMSITNSSLHSWWQVDLGSSQPIGAVKVSGRTDCCLDQSSDYWVFVSNNPFNTALTPAQLAATPGVWSSYQSAAAYPFADVGLPAGSTGRYVMVMHGNAADYLSLAEVQVYAH